MAQRSESEPRNSDRYGYSGRPPARLASETKHEHALHRTDLDDSLRKGLLHSRGCCQSVWHRVHLTTMTWTKTLVTNVRNDSGSMTLKPNQRHDHGQHPVHGRLSRARPERISSCGVPCTIAPMRAIMPPNRTTPKNKKTPTSPRLRISSETVTATNRPTCIVSDAKFCAESADTD